MLDFVATLQQNNHARFEHNKFILGGPGENQPEPHTFTFTILQSLLTGETHSNTFKTLDTEYIYIHSPYSYLTYINFWHYILFLRYQLEKVIGRQLGGIYKAKPRFDLHFQVTSQAAS